MLGEHIIYKFCAVFCRRSKTVYFFHHRAYEQVSKSRRFCLIDTRQTVFAEIGILETVIILYAFRFACRGFLYRIHGYFQRKHTVLNSFAGLEHTCTHPAFVSLAGLRFFVAFCSSVAEKYIIFAFGLGIFEIFNYLCSRIQIQVFHVSEIGSLLGY